MVFFGISMYFVIHQATQNLNYGPVMQSQGHQSMSVGTALFILWFPVLVFRNLVWYFPIGPPTLPLLTGLLMFVVRLLYNFTYVCSFIIV